jgi:hypothetical protein
MIARAARGSVYHIFTMPACRQDRKLGTSISERCGRHKTVRAPETVFGRALFVVIR